MAPDAGTYAISWFEPSGPVVLRSAASPAIRRGNATNHVEFSCTGTALTATVNGVALATVQDSRFGRDTSYFGAGAYAGHQLTVDARFDNWVLTDSSPAAPAALRPPAPTPTAAPTTGSHRLSGVLTIAGETAPAGLSVTSYIGDTPCGTAQTTANGSHSLAVLPASARSGCGRPGSLIRIGVRPAFGRG